MSKGIALLAVVGNFVQEKFDIFVFVFGVLFSALFYIFAYLTDKNINDE